MCENLKLKEDQKKSRSIYGWYESLETIATPIEEIKPKGKSLFNNLIKMEYNIDNIIQLYACTLSFVSALGIFNEYCFDDKTGKTKENIFQTACAITAGLLLVNMMKKNILLQVGSKIEKKKQGKLLENSTGVKEAMVPQKEKTTFNPVLMGEVIVDTLVQLGTSIVAFDAGMSAFDTNFYDVVVANSQSIKALHTICFVESGLLFANFMKKLVLLGLASLIEPKESHKENIKQNQVQLSDIKGASEELSDNKKTIIK